MLHLVLCTCALTSKRVVLHYAAEILACHLCISFSPKQRYAYDVCRSTSLFFCFSQAGEVVLCEPEVRRLALPCKGARVIIASDGLWDAMNPKTAAHHVRGMQASKAATELVSFICSLAILHMPNTQTTCLPVKFCRYLSISIKMLVCMQVKTCDSGQGRAKRALNPAQNLRQMSMGQSSNMPINLCW